MSATFWPGRRVVVTGGTGFLGHHLVSQLLHLGAIVRVAALPPRVDPPTKREVEYVFGDVCDREFVRGALRGADVVFHAAGPVAMWGPALVAMRRAHVEGTINVMAYAPATSRIVHTSSVVAIGATSSPMPMTEDSPFALGHLKVDYVHVKREAERIALERKAVVVNPGYLVGPDDPEGSVMGKMCVRAWKGRIPVAPPRGINLVDVRDVAAGHILAAEYGVPGRRYILGGEDTTFRDFLQALADAANQRPRMVPTLPGWLMRTAATVGGVRANITGKPPFPSQQHVRMHKYYWYASSARARAELGYTTRPLSESLADAHRWYTNAGMLSLRGFNRWWVRPLNRVAGPSAR